VTRRSFAALLPVVCLALTGCGGGWGTASGTVTLDGVPLKDATISFHPTGAGPTAYGIVKDGAFAISTGQKDGLPPGSYEVTISASTIPKEGTNEQAKLLTPKKYATPATTDLKAEVQSGTNTFKFEMKSK